MDDIEWSNIMSVRLTYGDSKLGLVTYKFDEDAITELSFELSYLDKQGKTQQE